MTQNNLHSTMIDSMVFREVHHTVLAIVFRPHLRRADVKELIVKFNTFVIVKVPYFKGIKVLISMPTLISVAIYDRWRTQMTTTITYYYHTYSLL